MTDRAKFEQMLEHLINGEQTKAEEIFHDLVVAKSREIYENLLDDDVQVDEADEDDEENPQTDDMDENFDLEAVGGDPADAMIDAVVDGEGDEMGGDEMDMGDEMGGGDEPATKDDVMDIKDALDELKAEFEAMLAGEEGGEEEPAGDEGDMDFGGDEEEPADDEEEKKEDFSFESDEDDVEEDMVREYVEKVAPAKMGDNGANTKSIVAGKNDMGGTTANIAKGGESKGGGTNGGLANPAVKDLNSGNVNTPGSKTATKMHSTKGHGAEKKGSGDNGANTKSVVGK